MSHIGKAKHRKVTVSRTTILKGIITRSFNNLRKWSFPSCITIQDLTEHGDFIFNCFVKRPLVTPLYYLLSLIKDDILKVSCDTLFMGMMSYIKIAPNKFPINLIDNWYELILNKSNLPIQKELDKGIRLAIDCRFHEVDGYDYFHSYLINILLFGDMTELYNFVYESSLIMADSYRINLFHTLLTVYGKYLNTEDEIVWKPPHSDDYRTSGSDDPTDWITKAESLNFGDFLVKICAEGVRFDISNVFFTSLFTHIFYNGDIDADLVLTEKSARRLHAVMDKYLTYLLFDFKDDFYDVVFASRLATDHWLLISSKSVLSCIRYAVPFFDMWAKRYWSTEVKKYNDGLNNYFRYCEIFRPKYKLVSAPLSDRLALRVRDGLNGETINVRLQRLVWMHIAELIHTNNYIFEVFFESRNGEYIHSFRDKKSLEEQLEELSDELKERVPDKYLRKYLMTFV